MRDRINAVRQRIAGADPRLAYIGGQFGMFSMLPLRREQVLGLRERDAIIWPTAGASNIGASATEQGRSISAAWSGTLEA